MQFFAKHFFWYLLHLLTNGFKLLFIVQKLFFHVYCELFGSTFLCLFYHKIFQIKDPINTIFYLKLIISCILYWYFYGTIFIFIIVILYLSHSIFIFQKMCQLSVPTMSPPASFSYSDIRVRTYNYVF